MSPYLLSLGFWSPENFQCQCKRSDFGSATIIDRNGLSARHRAAPAAVMAAAAARKLQKEVEVVLKKGFLASAAGSSRSLEKTSLLVVF